jgi:serine/threonine protein phosphatase PrpC
MSADKNRFISISSNSVGAREEQEDAGDVFIRNGLLLAVLCDGAGGHHSGREAALAAIDCVRLAFSKLESLPSKPEEWMREVCLTAHAKVQALGETPKLAPRTTIALLLLSEKLCATAHVGDSRIYHFRDGKVLHRTKDHSMVQIFHDKGEVGEDDMGVHPDQGRLLSALGTEEPPRISLSTQQVHNGDTFLLCSDGFWERLTKAEITEALATAPTQETLDRMVALAVERNGPKGDNTSAIWIGFAESNNRCVGKCLVPFCPALWLLIGLLIALGLILLLFLAGGLHLVRSLFFLK